MKTIAVIPARYASTRFPAKLMQDLGGKTVIHRTYEAAVNTGLFDDVFVVTDSILIYDEILNHGGKAIMSVKEHESGSDRIAEAVENLEVDIVVNVQGDEPLIPPELINQVAQTLANHPQCAISTIAVPIAEKSEMDNPNVVKVVLNHTHEAMYFSRAPIPFDRDGQSAQKIAHLRHLGIYAYRAEFLQAYTKLEPAPPEQAEALEQLRALWYGYRIAVHIASEAPPAGVDTPEDLERVRRLLGA
jgi:3-deoxy-manno-octulosonate cytidylyltransferase (CMP-KDO synthetase)